MKIRKFISCLLSAAMIFTMTTGFAFAADDSSADTTAPTASADTTTGAAVDTSKGDSEASTDTTLPSLKDVAGTAYENAVSALLTNNVVTGYADGTYRPEGNLTRAEACALIYRAFPHTEIAYPDPSGTFSDLANAAWAKDYIAYCVNNKIVVGYGDGTFHPAGNVTNNELITMLVRATGLADDATMVWPTDYISVADSVGITTGLVGITAATDGNKAAGRGNTAIMVYNTVESQNTADEPSDNAGDNTGDTSGDSNAGDNNGNNDSTTGSGILADYSGNAYGIIISTGQALDENSNTVNMVEFLMGETTYTLLARSSSTVDVSGLDEETGLVQLKMTRGKITAINPILNASVLKNGGDQVLLTPSTNDASLQLFKVKDAGKTYANYYASDADATADKTTYVGINNPVVVYTCEADGDSVKYSLGSTSDIREGSYIAAFSIDKDSEQIADVIIVVDGDDAADIWGAESLGNVETLNADI